MIRFLVILFLTGFFFTENTIISAETEKMIREPAVAGDFNGFYPSTTSRLKEMIGDFLNQADKTSFNGTPFAIIVPHAGYVFSGAVAGKGFKQIENLAPKTIFLIGSSHNWGYTGASVPNYDAYKTPLGTVPVNQKMISKLEQANPFIKRNVLFPARQSLFDSGKKLSVHAVEHSLEVEIPFLQILFSDFTIVPILFGSDDEKACRSIGKTLGRICAENKDCLIVCSTDLTHYPPYEAAKKTDKETLKKIAAMDVIKLRKYISEYDMQTASNLQTLMCGKAAVYCTIEAALEFGINNAEIIAYANSGDAPSPYGKKDRVVGYGTVLLYPVKDSHHQRNSLEDKAL